MLKKPSLNKQQHQMLIKDDNGIDNAHLFSYLLVMKRLLKNEDFIAMFQEISTVYKILICKYALLWFSGELVKLNTK